MKYIKQVNLLTGLLELLIKSGIVELIIIQPFNERYSEDQVFFLQLRPSKR